MLALDLVEEARHVQRLQAHVATPQLVELEHVGRQARRQQLGCARSRKACHVASLEGLDELGGAVAAELDQLPLGIRHRWQRGRSEVTQVQVQQVVVQRSHAAVLDLGRAAFVEVGGQLLWRPDHRVAAVILFQHHGYGLVGQEHQVDMVALVIGAHVLWVDPDPVARDERLELVLHVVQVRTGHHLVSDQEQLAAGPVVELVFDRRLVDHPAIPPVDGHDGFEEHVLARALWTVNDQGGLHLGARVLDWVRQPLQAELVQLLGLAIACAHVAQQVQQVVAGTGLRRGGPARPQVAHDVLVGAGRVKSHLRHTHDLLVWVLAPGTVQLTRQARIAHVAQGHQLVFLVVEQRTALAVHQRIALQQLVERVNWAQALLFSARPRPPWAGCPRGFGLRDAPVQCREAGLHLGAHHMQPFGHMQVVEVVALGALVQPG